MAGVVFESYLNSIYGAGSGIEYFDANSSTDNSIFGGLSPDDIFIISDESDSDDESNKKESESDSDEPKDEIETAELFIVLGAADNDNNNGFEGIPIFGDLFDWDNAWERDQDPTAEELAKIAAEKQAKIAAEKQAKIIKEVADNDEDDIMYLAAMHHPIGGCDCESTKDKESNSITGSADESIIGHIEIGINSLPIYGSNDKKKLTPEDISDTLSLFEI